MSTMSEEFGAAMKKAKTAGGKLVVVTAFENGVVQSNTTKDGKVAPWPAKQKPDDAAAVVAEDTAKREKERKAGVEAGEAAKEMALSKVAEGRQPLVDAAKGIAVELSKKRGPITIEDVEDEMRRRGFEDLDSGSKDSPKNWKGAVFGNNPLFACVGQEPSKNPKEKGRNVRRWVLLTWLQDNPMGGSHGSSASFDLWKIYQDWRHFRTNDKPEDVVFLVGTDCLAKELSKCAEPPKDVFLATGERVGAKLNTIYGISIIPVDFCVGAMIVSRQYAKEVLPDNIKKYLGQQF